MIKHGNQDNGMFIGSYLRQECSFSQEIYSHLINMENPTDGDVIQYLESIGFEHLEDTYYAHNSGLKLDVYRFTATGQLTVSFRGHDAKSVKDLKQRYSFARKLAEYPQPLSTY